ncbi:metalloregulator ArsR/SmtB family transcription factor [Patescibacteria group bacterium]|nr:metalloregulator ArsR/SmtB family transcription factor [Patescibacteria group bacterium]MBU2259473.1 metalloregulator ArsR/SmtB family transcription factor [Patescibacteria group bacterium]
MNRGRILELQCKALGNAKRLNILIHLKDGSMESVSEIAQIISLRIKPTSKHLQKLEAAYLLERRKRGLHVYYHLPLKRPAVLKAVLKTLN